MGAQAAAAFDHTSDFRRRRFFNWFPMGFTYAFLYMGRYNLTVAKNALGELMTKEDFGLIFGVGTAVYAFAFLFNGPLVDRIGGRKGILIAAMGAALANLSMGLYLNHVMGSGEAADAPLRTVFSVLYATNMYFQSFGAVSIVKVNAHWFHVRERGGFSGIFGTMISSGIFFAFTANSWVLEGASALRPGTPMQWVVFVLPGGLLLGMFILEFFLLRDRPSHAGHEDFDTGDASSGDDSDEPAPTGALLKKILTNPIILTVAGIEFCTGILRNGVMHWFPFYAKEVWALPGSHPLRYGSWDYKFVIIGCFVVAAISAVLAKRSSGKRRGMLAILGGLAFLAPFLQAGWGGILFCAGVIGGNVAGWVSDLFFQSRRGPAAGGLYLFLAICCGGMIFVLAPSTNVVEYAGKNARASAGLQVGDEVVAIAGKSEIRGWGDVANAVACWQPQCVESQWDAQACMCSTKAKSALGKTAAGPIPATVKRDGQVVELELKDPKPKQRAGDRRKLEARPVLPLSPFLLGALVFLMSLCVIGTHGLLSGTATMDFGGRKGAATAVGVIDGFVYLGTAVQSVSLGYLTSRNWSYWPLFLLPFAILGFLLCTRIWNATPKGSKAH